MDYRLYIYYGTRRDLVSCMFNATDTGIAELTTFAEHFPGHKWEILDTEYKTLKKGYTP